MNDMDQIKAMIQGVTKILDEKVVGRDRESKKFLIACAEYLDEAVALLDKQDFSKPIEEKTENEEVNHDSENEQGE